MYDTRSHASEINQAWESANMLSIFQCLKSIFSNKKARTEKFYSTVLNLFFTRGLIFFSPYIQSELLVCSRYKS